MFEVWDTDTGEVLPARTRLEAHRLANEINRRASYAARGPTGTEEYFADRRSYWVKKQAEREQRKRAQDRRWKP